jgi:hypothetical protein
MVVPAEQGKIQGKTRGREPFPGQNFEKLPYIQLLTDITAKREEIALRNNRELLVQGLHLVHLDV